MALCLKHQQEYKPEEGEKECPQCKREREDSENKSNSNKEDELDLMK